MIIYSALRICFLYNLLPTQSGCAKQQKSPWNTISSESPPFCLLQNMKISFIRQNFCVPNAPLTDNISCGVVWVKLRDSVRWEWERGDFRWVFYLAYFGGNAFEIFCAVKFPINQWKEWKRGMPGHRCILINGGNGAKLLSSHCYVLEALWAKRLKCQGCNWIFSTQ